MPAKEMDLRETLLRITGAIQVLEEELARGEQEVEDGADQFDLTNDKSVAMLQQNMLS